MIYKNNIGRGRALRIAFGIATLFLLIAEGAGATRFIRDNTTGGDCTSFGTWNAVTMTCSMTMNLTEIIQIDSNGVTLDGNGYTLTGMTNAFGVTISYRSGVTIKNMNIEGFSGGVFLDRSNNNYLIGNNVSNITAGIGIALAESNNNVLIGNNVSNNYGGIYLSSYDNNNILSNNNVNSNYVYGIYLAGSSYNTLIGNIANSNKNKGIFLSYSNNNILNNNDASNTINGWGIDLSSTINNTLSSNNASNNSGGGILLQFSSNSTLSGNKANSNNNNAGIYLGSSDNNILSGNIANSNKDAGIKLYGSNNNTLSNNNANLNNNYGIYLIGSYNKLSNNNANSNNNFGIYLYSSSNNMLSGNNVNSNNIDSGIYLDFSSNNTLSGNNASKNNYGIYLYNSRDNTMKGNNASSNYNYGIYLSSNPPYSYRNKIYNNYFNNAINYGSRTGNATWNISRTSDTNIIGGPYLGGNYWAYPDGTGYSQKCSDTDKDGICDSPYTVDTNNIDYLPLTELNPAIIVFTDKTGYIQGNKMYVGLNITNPGSARNAGIYIWIDLPGGGKFQVANYSSVTLPAGLEYNKMPWKVITLPNIAPGNYAWHAVLWEPVAKKSISESISPWTFGTAATAGAGSIKELENAFQGGYEEVYFVK